MYRIIFSIILTLSVLPAFAERTYVTEQPVYNSYYVPQAAYYGGYYNPRNRYIRNSGSRFTDINDLERYATGKNFFRESDITRIERMELLAFGAIQEGDINSRYANVREAILSRPKQNYKSSILKSISNYFTGQMTGYTPPINTYNTTDSVFPFLDNSFGKSTITDYSSPWGKGYKINNYGTGSSAGVHILD